MRHALIVILGVLVAACEPGSEASAPPPPMTLTASAAGHYCQMTVLDHAGPKAQVHLQGNPHPLWFTQVRDAIAYQRQPEQPAEITAIYVSDMGTAPSWDEPGTNNWIDVTSAHFVIGSEQRGGMGAPELVPFARAEDAQRFTNTHGGHVVGLSQVSDDMVLGPVDVDPEALMPGIAHHGGEG